MNHKKSDKLWIFGRHAVVSAIETNKRDVYSLALTKNAFEELKSAALLSDDYKIEICDSQRITNIVGKDSVHQGYAALVSEVEKIDPKILLKILEKQEYSTVIALDQITDPQNVGSIIRSAVALNIDALITTRDNSVIDSPIISKTSSGGIEHIKIVCATNLVMTLKLFKEAGYWIIGLDAGSKESIKTISQFNKVVIVLGSEDQGLRRLTKSQCDLMLKIPMSDKMESLNVANASAIAMFCHSNLK